MSKGGSRRVHAGHGGPPAPSCHPGPPPSTLSRCTGTSDYQAAWILDGEDYGDDDDDGDKEEEEGDVDMGGAAAGGDGDEAPELEAIPGDDDAGALSLGPHACMNACLRASSC